MTDFANCRTLTGLLLERLACTPGDDALYRPDGSAWKAISWRELGEYAFAVAGGLLSLGLQNEECAAILSGTRVEWMMVDLGVMCAGGATAGIYSANTPEECAHIARDAGARFLFAENLDLVQRRLSPVRGDLPGLRRVFVFDGPGGEDGWVVPIAELLEQGRAWNRAHPGSVERVARAVSPQGLAMLLYTSGTTGRQKGVEVTHDAMVFESESIEATGMMSPADRQLLFLPFAHSFARVLEVAILRTGVATAMDGRVDRVAENISTFRPTFVAAVPRIFEKVYNKVIESAREGGAARFAIFKWAVSVGREVAPLRQNGRKPGGLLAMKLAVADRLVFGKLRARFGGRLRFFISGGAPLSTEIIEFFFASGLFVLEGYGLTESGAGSFCNVLGRSRFGTVGPPLPGVEARLAPEDHEILIRSRGLMRRYRGLPELTAEVFTEDGWLRTGDVGEIDAEGFLQITDRKKDLIKTSGGKCVAPQELENKLKTLSSLVSQVVVHGDRRNYCTALITLDSEAARKWAPANGHEGKTIAELVESGRFDPEIQRAVDRLNSGLASYATIKKFAILPQDFSVETGELTPSMKVRRRVVERRYRDLLDGLYEGAVTSLLSGAGER